MMMALVIMKTPSTITMVTRYQEFRRATDPNDALDYPQTIMDNTTKKKSLVPSPTTLILMGMVLATFTTLSANPGADADTDNDGIIDSQMRTTTGMAILMLVKMN